jgi:predicted Fe-Mo cluster-binding NifX family protein
MKIVVTAAAPSLDGAVDPRSGRCPYFLIVESDDLTFEAIENPNVQLGGGAGIQSAQLMNEKGVQFVLTGNCGPNAFQTLSAAGIEVIVGCSGLVRDVVEQFRNGRLGPSDQPNVASHFGTGNPTPDNALPPAQQPPTIQAGQPFPMTGPGMGTGAGGGAGRGMGRGGGGGGMGRGGGGRGMGRGGGGRGMGRGGGGRGMGRGGAMGAGTLPPAPIPTPAPDPTPSVAKQDELEMLKQQSEAMIAQMRQIQERIRQLEEGEGTTGG